MTAETHDLRTDLATATRILALHGLVGFFGHASVLTDDPGHYLISPGAGARKDLCRSSDIIHLSLDDDFIPGRPLELYMHAELHRSNPQLRSVIHVHSPALVTLSSMAEVPSDLLMLHGSFWPTRMPLWEEAELVRDRQRASQLVQILGDEAIALLRWHGAVIVGRTLSEAVFRTVLAEDHARQILAALSHGRPLAPVPLSANRDELSARFLMPHTYDMHWKWASTFVEIAADAQGRM